MRLAGRVTEWNDDKSFGFVAPNGGGERAFVHVNEFQRGSRRPTNGDLISYLLAKDQRGRLNARQIRHAGERIQVKQTPSRVPRATIGAAVLALVAALAAMQIVPVLFAGAIVGVSALAYGMYCLDKSAAQASRQRTPESTLHFVSLIGGWPGALIAQQQFRHKTIKQPFQTVFWTTVLFNIVLVAWLLSSGVAAEVLQSLSG